MIVTKYTVANFFLFATCLILFLMLFSMESNPQPRFNFKKLTLPYPSDLRLFDLNFKYLINNDKICTHSDITAVILVTSYYGDIETRSAMRRSFSNEKLKEMKLRRVFLLAIGPQANKFDVNYKAILNENERFGDLIQGNFIEAYRNLTYKHIMGLRWASTYCKSAKYVIKMDDDIVVNMHKLSNILDDIESSKNDDFLAGYIMRGMVPIREPANKWYVTRQEYKNSMYPPFISGWFYVTKPKVAQKLVELSQKSPYFWIDDVLVTGILAKQWKIRHYNLNYIFAVHSEYLQCCIHGVVQNNYECDLLVGPNGGDSNLFYTFNKIMSKCQREKCVKRPSGKSLNDTCVAEKKIFMRGGKALIENFKLF